MCACVCVNNDIDIQSFVFTGANHYDARRWKSRATKQRPRAKVLQQIDGYGKNCIVTSKRQM